MFIAFTGSPRREIAFVATKKGIFTETGTWFAATEDSLRAYAGRVLEVRPLPRLLADADVWLRSPQTLAVWSFLVLLSLLPPVPALLATMTVYAGWRVLGPSFVSLIALKGARLLDNVLIQGMAYIVILSLFAGDGMFSAVWTGLAGFIILRWGIVERLFEPLLRPAHRSLYELPVPDQVLRALVVRTAIKHDIDLPQIRDIERSIRDKWT